MRSTCVVQARLGTGACVGSGTRDGEAAGRKSERFRLFSRHYATDVPLARLQRGLKPSA